jgi:PAS domain S-box-containing protein
MSRPLRVLIVEDSPDDAEFLLLELARGGYDPSYEQVETEDAMRAALAQPGWEIVVSDYWMPTFTAPAALAVLKSTGLDIPFIVVSGTIGEDAAVEALTAGADDFVVKGKLARLLPAIERGLRECKVRKERREAEESARRANENLRLLIDGVHDYAMYVVGPGGTVVTWNAGAQRLKGYSAAEVVGKDFSSFYPPEEVAAGKPARDLATALARARTAEEGWSVRKDGTRFWASAVLTPLYDVAGAHVGFAKVTRDLTEWRRLEEQFRQAQKMEAVGRLAGGIAHDFNNVLSVILSYAEAIEDGLGPDEPMRADVAEIRKAGDRAAQLTRQLLAFSRRQVLNARVLDLSKTVAGMADMLRRVLGAGISQTTLCASGLWSVKADAGQIEQVVMNLAVNARDAMPKGGKFTVEIANAELDDEYARLHHDLEPGSYVMLAVSDTGTGMDKETLARIFEPFFTTKEPGRGTGLGLATVFGIVKQSGGHIWVYSEPGQGTTFKIYLPKVSGPADAHPSARPPLESVGGTETILLVEDDEQVRAVACGILRRNGYVVLEAPNAGEAMLICEEHGAKIHLLLTDVVLPRMGGGQLAERLLAVRPEMKVLFMSGYTDDAILQHGVLDSGVAYLQKPLTPGALTRKVRDVLNG